MTALVSMSICEHMLARLILVKAAYVSLCLLESDYHSNQ